MPCPCHAPAILSWCECHLVMAQMRAQSVSLLYIPKCIIPQNHCFQSSTRTQLTGARPSAMSTRAATEPVVALEMMVLLCGSAPRLMKPMTALSARELRTLVSWQARRPSRSFDCTSGRALVAWSCIQRSGRTERERGVGGRR